MKFLKRYQNSLIEYVKYSMIGLTCGAIDLGVLNGLIYFFPTQQTSWLTFYNTISYTLAVLNSYIWNSKYTFKVKKNTKQFVIFILQSIFSLFIANIVFIAGLWMFGLMPALPKWLKENIAKLLSMFISSTASFFFNKYIVFRKKPALEEELKSNEQGS